MYPIFPFLILRYQISKPGVCWCTLTGPTHLISVETSKPLNNAFVKIFLFVDLYTHIQVTIKKLTLSYMDVSV